MGAFEKIAVADLKFRVVFGPAAIVFMVAMVASWEVVGTDGVAPYAIAFVPAALTAYAIHRLLQ